MRVRIVARRSPLAVAQATLVADRLRELGADPELVGVDTLGDVDRRHLTTIGGTGVFAAAVRGTLLDGHAEVAVHSLKDLPVSTFDGLEIIAVPAREDPRDVLIGTPPESWTDDTVIGTGSPRRGVQIQSLAAEYGVQPQLVPVRGNVDTRLSLVRDGIVTATVLAAAGLRRLGRWDGRDDRVDRLPATAFTVDDVLPAPGQGALAIETRADVPDDLRSVLSQLDDHVTRAEVSAERSFLATLEAGCLAPVGAFGYTDGADLTLRAVAGRKSGDPGDVLVRDRDAGTLGDADAIGRRLAHRMLVTLGTVRPDQTPEGEERR